MKNKVLLKSLFHAAQLSEQIQKLMIRKEIIDAFGEEPIQSDITLLKGCTEKDYSLYNANRLNLAISGLIDNSYYDAVDYDYDFSAPLVTRYYKIKDGMFVSISFCDPTMNASSPNFLKTIFEIASLQSKINKILLRNQVAEEFDDMSYFKVEGFERNCVEQNCLLYDSNGSCLADGDKYEPTGMIDNLYYVDSHCCYLEDDYYGTMYYKISDKLFVKVSYSC